MTLDRALGLGFAATLVVASLGCTGHGAPADESLPSTYLVWDYETTEPIEPTANGRFSDSIVSEHVPYTRWIARDTDGSVRELGRRRGLWVVADDSVWKMRHGTKTWTSATCAALDGDPNRPDRVNHVSRSVDFGAPDGRTQPVIQAHETPPGYEPDTPTDEVFVGDYVEHHAPVAGIGSLIIFRSTTYSYECGAHGGVGASYLAFDLDNGTHPDLVGEGRDLGETSAHLEKVRADLIVRNAWEDAEVELTAVYPRVRLEDGKLETRLQYTSPSCYACSDGAWDSYSVSSEVVSTRLPASLRADATVPAIVVKALAGIDQDNGFGWSAVPTTGSAYDEVAKVFGGAPG